MPSTPFALVYLDVLPVTSGSAVGGLVTGIGSILVSFVVIFFGLVGAAGGWGGWVAGAFTVLAVFLAAAGVVLGWLGRRQVGRSVPQPAVRFTGGGLAMAGIICGSVGFCITSLGLAVALLLQLS